MEQANANDGNVVDLLVLWTPKSLEHAGGEAEMRTGIDMVVASANDAYERSGAEVRLNLVGAEQVDYVETEYVPGAPRGYVSGTDLSRLENPSDGFMDEAHERRNALGADLISLFTGLSDTGGIAALGGPFSFVNVAEDGFGYRQGYAFTHEVGHISTPTTWRQATGGRACPAAPAPEPATGGWSSRPTWTSMRSPTPARRMAS